ncbi:MAG: hypothetical protein KDK36_08645, partial [Leptospiraceae bacterium]|nr:hypothetical protein [Leptospiraceae bacterium]
MIFKEEIEGITISPATSPEIDEIIEKVFNESVNPRYYYKSNFKNSPTYQDLKKKDDVLKSSIALRVLDYMKSLNDLYEKEKEKEETKFRSKAFNLYYKKVMVFNNILEDML